MSTSDDLREVFTAGRPLIERWLDIAEQIAGVRNLATAKGLDWSQVKALLKAQIQDERDDSGEGKRVARIVEKAEFASAYADMLGLAKMNEIYFSDGHDPETGEVIEHSSQADADDGGVPPAQASVGTAAETPFAGTGGEADRQPRLANTGGEDDRSPLNAAQAGEEQAQADASPALKPKNPFRPHCQRPHSCASSSPRAHCYGCQQAHAEANGETA